MGLFKKKIDSRKVMAWIVIILISSSVLGAIGGAIFSPSGGVVAQTEEYNGYTFSNNGGQWVVSVGGQELYFSYPPKAVEDLVIPLDLTSWRNSQAIYLGYNPKENNTASSEMTYLAGTLSILGIRSQLACTVEDDCPDIPVVDCSKSTIVFSSGNYDNNKTVISNDNNCLMVETKDFYELHRITERIIYGLLGVM